MGCLVRIVVGVILVALGAAIALLVPPFMEENAAASIMIREVTPETVADLEVGDDVLMSGTVDEDKNKTFEHGIVIGHRLKRTKASNDSGKNSTEAAWTPVQDFRQPLTLVVTAVGEATVTLDNVGLAGDVVDVERENERWVGVKRGQTISVPCAITATSPLACDEKVGETIFVGSPAEWRKNKTETASNLTHIFWVMGGVFVLGGVIVVLTAPSKRKKS